MGEAARELDFAGRGRSAARRKSSLADKLSGALPRRCQHHVLLPRGRRYICRRDIPAFYDALGVERPILLLTRFDLLSEAAGVRCPTLVLGGELDPITTVADLEDLAAAMPGSELTIVPGTGHGLRSKADEALAIVGGFIASDPP